VARQPSGIRPAAPPPPLGWHAADRTFRLQAPCADAVWLVSRRHPDDERSEQIQRMVHPGRHKGVNWFEIHAPTPQRYYRFRVHQQGLEFDIADPRSLAVARQFVVGHPTWSVALDDPPFNWHGDARPGIDVGSALLLELHVRDFTCHPSAGSRHPGTFAGIHDLQPGAPGGLHGLCDLGVNTVELLPLATWPVLEPRDGGGLRVNHWGYMPSFLLACSERYGTHGVDPKPGEWVGVDDDGTFHDPGRELQELVRVLHRHGIAVVVDMVLNHVSLHDANPLFALDPGTWFHRNGDGSLRSHSGCGNDLNTADPAMRLLAVDAVRHWLHTYRLDGVRLDLAALLDDETLHAIHAAAKQAHPRAIVISEPWSMAGYRPTDIADLGHTVWNDRFRNGLKGHHPLHGRGFAFGRWDGNANRSDVAALLLGWDKAAGGPLRHAYLSLNYLESHDNYTLGDFVRMALEQVREGLPVARNDVAEVAGHALQVHELLATALLGSRGVVMLAQGQEWGRAKVQHHQDGSPGALDGNSYDRDDATNHLDWTDRARNPELVDHYRRLVSLRKEWLLPAFALGNRPTALFGSTEFGVGYRIDTPRGRLAVLLNGGGGATWFQLPGGPWWSLVQGDRCNIVPVHGGVAVRVDATAGAVLYEGGVAVF
jgi:pullulanase/glycogen debranching enzyme